MIGSLIVYFQFFTRIPIRVSIPDFEQKMRSGIRYFSLLGLLIGCIEAVVFFAAQFLFGSGLAWVIALFFDVLMTGAFHQDALMDMADGLFSSRNRERMLEIMKDSRVGSMAVMAGIFYYLVMVTSFYTLLPFTTLLQQVLLVVMIHMVGKTGISLMMYHMHYAGSSPKGLGAVFMNAKTSDVAIAQLLAVIVLFLAFDWLGLVGYLTVAVGAVLYRRHVTGKVGGFNGDTLGATASVCQLVFMLTMVALRSFL